MAAEKGLEMRELDSGRRKEYLERYYDAAREFYGFCDRAVTDTEIDECVKSLKKKPASVIRKKIPLDNWYFRPDMSNEGIGQGYFSGEYDETGWEKVNVPHTFSQVSEDPVKYGRTRYAMYLNERGPDNYTEIWKGETHAWYKTRVPLGELKQDEIACLSFESINLLSDVWVNDYPVMMDHLGLFPFKMEVTDELKAFYADNPVIAVRVSGIPSNMPGMFYNGFQFDYISHPRFTKGKGEMAWDDRTSSGMAGEAALAILNKNHIDNVFIHTEDITQKEALVRFNIELANYTWNTFRGTVKVVISRWLPEEGGIVRQAEMPVSTLPMENQKADVSVILEDPSLWTVETPNLYLAHIVLYDEDGRPIDDIYETFGVRTIKMMGRYIYLNGNKIVPRGTHDVCHYYNESDIAPSDRIIAEDLLLHKRMGANCSRWPSDARMHCQRIAEYCDQFGLMLIWSGFFEVWNIHPEAEMYNTRDVKEMIRSLRNHPSIIVWEMGDEVLQIGHEYRRMQWYSRIYDLVTAEDDTRPVIPCGAWCNDWSGHVVKRIRDNDNSRKLPLSELRKQILDEFPIYDRKLALLDMHKCIDCRFTPMDNFAEDGIQALDLCKPVNVTEFGTDGIPDPEKLADIYDEFRWKSNPFWSYRKDIVDEGLYGRNITGTDWKETQAFQALIDIHIIDKLRQHSDIYASFSFVTMFDLGTAYWGAVDAKGRCKLLYFTASSYFKPVLVSALHEYATVKRPDRLVISVSNFGGDIYCATLKVIIRDREDHHVRETEFAGIHAEGNVKVSEVAGLDLEGIPDGLYSLEYYLYGSDGKLLGKTLELGFLE